MEKTNANHKTILASKGCIKSQVPAVLTPSLIDEPAMTMQNLNTRSAASERYCCSDQGKVAVAFDRRAVHEWLDTV